MKIEKLSERIRFAMEKKGIKSNIDLVGAADVSEASLYKWLREEEIPRGSSRYKLAKALGVDPEWLRTGEGDIEPTAALNPYAWLEQLAPAHNGKIQMHEGIVNLLIAATQESTAYCLAAGLPLDTDRMNALVMAVVQRCYDEGTPPQRKHVADALAQMIHSR